MTPVDGKMCSIFEIDILSDLGRIQLVNNGVIKLTWDIAEKNDYGAYPSFDYTHKMEQIQTNFETSLESLYDNLLNYWEFEADLHCTERDALAVHRIYEQIIGEIKT